MNRPPGTSILLASALALAPRVATADDAAPAEGAHFEEDAPNVSAAKKLAQAMETGPYLRLFSTAMVGDGLRLNNPFRLSTELGKTGQSLSATAPYADLGLGATFGRPDGVQHGAHVGWSFALGGVMQHVLTPSYVAVHRGPSHLLLLGRAGLPIVLSPDPNLGGELAMGAGWFFTAGIGAAASVVLDGFYGAATREVRAAFYPVVSGQLGVIVDYEVLP